MRFSRTRLSDVLLYKARVIVNQGVLSKMYTEVAISVEEMGDFF